MIMIRILWLLVTLTASTLQAEPLLAQPQPSDAQQALPPQADPAPTTIEASPFTSEEASDKERPVVTNVDTPLNHVVISAMMLLMVGSVFRPKRNE
jgi:hypothetical protein